MVLRQDRYYYLRRRCQEKLNQDQNYHLTLRVLRNDIAGRMNEVRPGSREYHGLEREDIELVSMYETVMGQVKEVHGKGRHGEQAEEQRI